MPKCVIPLENVKVVNFSKRNPNPVKYGVYKIERSADGVDWSNGIPKGVFDFYRESDRAFMFRCVGSADARFPIIPTAEEKYRFTQVCEDGSPVRGRQDYRKSDGARKVKNLIGRRLHSDRIERC